MSTTITRKDWGTHKGENLYLFKLTNSTGAYAEISNYGATLVSVVVPDQHGDQGNVILGFAEAAAYLDDKCYIGSTVGRFANRIGGAKFELNGQTYHLEANDGVNSNHGASSGFNYRVFGFEIVDDHLVLVLHSNDGDGGFPGSLNLRVTYKWSDDNELSIHYAAVSDQDTIANFTNHAYFNLSEAETMLDHRLTISGDTIVDAGEDYIPTGEIKPAAEIEFKGDILKEILQQNSGINSFYILNDNDIAANGYAAKLTDETSGRFLEVTTSYSGVFLYTGDYLASQYLNHNNRYCQPFEGLCLECQHYPDSINHPQFPSPVLKKHKVYDEYINFKFGLI
ncbi:galactose mutarotase [Mucilaginibacter gynuensis]|uniref:Aldose 1-epimerase n=1 Tax=Mucilaginibacter gynuensis TaxID=1302236 RepID=A0ABP8FMB6_9SPHI